MKKLIAMLFISIGLCFGQFEENAKVLTSSSQVKQITFYLTVNATATHSSSGFECKDLGKKIMYFGTLCNSATAGVKISASIWGSFDGVNKDSLTTLFVDRTAETNLVDTISVTAMQQKYPYYYICFRGGASGNAVDTKVRLTVYAIKD